MAKTGRYIYQASNISDVAAVGTSFDGAKLSAVSLNMNTVVGAATRFSGRIEGVIVKVKSIAGGATQITMRGVTSDNVVILPDTAANIALDIADPTVGTVAYVAGLDWANANDTLKIYCKTDAGTVTVDAVYVTWSE